MLKRLFPDAFDNRFRGLAPALWLFWPIVLMSLAIDLGGIFAPDGGAQSADGIPLSTYDHAGAAAVIGVAAFLGLASLMFDLLCVLAALRYRAMVPLLYALLVAQFLAHKAIGAMKPIPRIPSASGGEIALTIFAVTVLGLVLSLTGKGYRTTALSPPGR